MKRARSPLKFAEAEGIAPDLHAKWEVVVGSPAPMPADDPRWADLIQLILRRAVQLHEEKADV